SKRFQPDAATWKSLMDYVAENKIELPSLLEKDRVEIIKRIKSSLARQMWGVEGYYEVSNVSDLTVQKAMATN
ncbi:MAG: carboxyl-terminal protease, partial [Chitinophagaceae bacterium]|nr:carboxyl-terminal protease [Chitinophagaceae bacterium]